MATRIPLNFFRRVSFETTTTPTPIYVTPLDRAAIIISAYASNLTTSTQTINLMLSTQGESGSMYTIVSAWPILPNDAVNVVINKIVLTENDTFIVSSQNNNAININLSILESVNIP
jgi:hypothetical protein